MAASRDMLELESFPRRIRSEHFTSEPHFRIGTFGLVHDGAGESRSFMSDYNDMDFLEPSPIGRRGALFQDPQKMKEILRKQMCKEEYTVETLYRTQGFWQRLSRSRKFEMVTFFVIILNSLWIGFDAEVNDYDVVLEAPPLYFLIENLFCAFFSFELLARFLSFRRKRDCLKDGWFAFDSLLVILMVLETWIVTLVLLAAGYRPGHSGMAALTNGSAILRMGKLVRLTRLARMARLVRAFPEMVILIKGMLMAVRPVVFTLFLLSVLTYVFGIMFKELAEGTRSGEEYFPHLGTAMLTLLVQGTLIDNLADLTDVLVEDAGEKGTWYFLVIFYVYVFMSALTILNMLIGVVCEAVSFVAAMEREENTIHMVKRKLNHIIQPGLSGVGSVPEERGANATISREQFKALIENHEAVECLSAVGVDVVGLVDIADFLFEDHGVRAGESAAGSAASSLPVSDFIEVVLRLRGSNWATVKDLVETRRFVGASVASLERRLLALPGVASNSPATRQRGSVTPRPARQRDSSHGRLSVPELLNGLAQRDTLTSDSLGNLMLVARASEAAGAKEADSAPSDNLAELLADRAAEVEAALHAAQQSFSKFARETVVQAQTALAAPAESSGSRR